MGTMGDTGATGEVGTDLIAALVCCAGGAGVPETGAVDAIERARSLGLHHDGIVSTVLLDIALGGCVRRHGVDSGAGTGLTGGQRSHDAARMAYFLLRDRVCKRWKDWKCVMSAPLGGDEAVRVAMQPEAAEVASHFFAVPNGGQARCLVVDLRGSLVRGMADVIEGGGWSTSKTWEQWIKCVEAERNSRIMMCTRALSWPVDVA